MGTPAHYCPDRTVFRETWDSCREAADDMSGSQRAPSTPSRGPSDWTVRSEVSIASSLVLLRELQRRLRFPLQRIRRKSRGSHHIKSDASGYLGLGELHFEPCRTRWWQLRNLYFLQLKGNISLPIECAAQFVPSERIHRDVAPRS